MLSELLARPPLPPDPACGAHTARTRAVILEDICIGCRKCIDVCPVDAIVGARKHMHTVIAKECTGCELCLPPCDMTKYRAGPRAEAHLGAPQVEGKRIFPIYEFLSELSEGP